MKNKIFFNSLITGIILIFLVLYYFAFQKINLFFGIVCMIVGGLQVFVSFDYTKKVRRCINIICFLIEIIYYVIAFFLIIVNDLSVAEYVIAIMTMILIELWLIYAIKFLCKR